jgi:predicted ATP-grasp superfamily ATP-dependent carboligase
MVKILVLDGRSLASLAIVRSLGKKGFEIHSGEEFRLNLTSFSKYVKKTWVYPSPELQADEFIKKIKSITIKEKIDMIIPIRDATTLLIAKYANELSHITNIFVAEFDTIKVLQDKGETLKVARKCGIPYPKTFFPEEMEIADIIKDLPEPALIRARVSSGSRGIAFVANRDTFFEKYNLIKKDYGEPIVQEYVKKRSYCSVCLLLDKHSNEVASFTYEKTKEYPQSGGPTVVGYSCNNQKAKNYALQLLKKVGWQGVAEADFIIDQQGIPRLLEINPRFWMPLNLAIKSGVDFPYLLYQLAFGYKTNKIQDYKIGFKFRWVLPNEILWLLSTPNKKQGLKEFITFKEKDTCYGDLSLEDPLPILGIFAQSMYFLTDKKKRQAFLNRGW